MVFFFLVFYCLSGNYFGTGKGYKHEILLEGVVKKIQGAVFFLIQNIHIFPPKR